MSNYTFRSPNLCKCTCKGNCKAKEYTTGATYCSSSFDCGYQEPLRSTILTQMPNELEINGVKYRRVQE